MKTTLLALLAMTTSAMAMGKYKTDANIAGKLNETLLRGPGLKTRMVKKNELEKENNNKVLQQKDIKGMNEGCEFQNALIEDKNTKLDVRKN